MNSLTANPESEQPNGDGASSPEETTFAREGPEAPQNPTGRNVAEMNEAAGKSLVRNVEPDESVD